MRGTVSAARAGCAGMAACGVLLTAGLIGRVQSSPVGDQSAPQLTTDQVLRRVADWMDTLDTEQRQQQQQQQRTLDSIQDHMYRMGLELERLETKMDLKMDRLQEVLIGRDIKDEENNKRMSAQLERTSLLVTEVSGQVQRMDTQVKGSLDQTAQKVTTIQNQIQIFQANLISDMKLIHRMIREDPTTSDVSAATSDVTPELRRLAASVERLQRGVTCRDGADSPADSPARHGPDIAAGRGPRSHDADQVESSGPEQHILQVSEQLLTGLVSLDEQVGHEFENLRNNLAMLASSVRDRFFEQRGHLEEVAAEIIAVQTAAVASSTGAGRHPDDRDGRHATTLLDMVVGALEAALYDVVDVDLWYMLPTRLEEAISGQGNLTKQIARVEDDMHQGFSKLYAQLTKLSDDLKARAVRDEHETHVAGEMERMFGNITQELHGIQLKLATPEPI